MRYPASLLLLLPCLCFALACSMGPSGSERRIRVDRECPGLVPERTLCVRELVLDEHAIRLEYVISPALPDWNHARGLPSINWEWRAHDDLGTAYEQAGGAYGMPPGSEDTEGVLSLTPLPPPGAQVLTVVLNPWFESEADARECQLDVDLTIPSE